MELQVSVVDVKKFTVSNQYRSFVAEASDLGRVDLQKQLYDDACDVGFALYNAFTAHTTRWAHSEDVYDNEGDLTVTYYIPTPETLRKYPMLKGWKIHILND